MMFISALSPRTSTGRQNIAIAFCWLVCFYWHSFHVSDETRERSAESVSSAWKVHKSEAAAAAASAALARERAAAMHSNKNNNDAASASASAPAPGSIDGLQFHGIFGASPAWPQREMRCPVPIVLPSEPERYKRISGLYRNQTSTLPFHVHSWAAGKDGNERSELPLLRASSLEVSRFVGMQEDILERYGVTMQVNNRFDVRLMSPAIVHIGDGRWLLFARISCYPAELYDNLLWTQELDAALDPIPGTGGVIGVPTHSQFLMAPGPEDPRTVVMNGEILVVFNHQYRNDDRRMILYNHAQKRLSELSIEGLTQARAEKNWMPFVHDGELHLVYQMTPLIVIKCELPSGKCICVMPVGECHGVQAVSKGVTARGGTPLTQVADGLFAGLLHSTYRHHMIRAHLVLLSTRPWGWVTISGPLPVPESLPGCYEGQVPWDVQFPSSMILLGPYADALLMGVHVRDAMGALIHVNLGTTMPDYLRSVTSVSCEEEEIGVTIKAPAAPQDWAPNQADPPNGHFSHVSWLTSDGKEVPACKRWAILPEPLDGILVPSLH